MNHDRVPTGLGWKSSVLRSFGDPDHCPTCRFIEGDRTTRTLMAVIENLDSSLARSELLSRTLVAAMGDASPGLRADAARRKLHG